MKVLTYKIGIRECDSCVGTVLDDIGLKISSVTYFFLSSVMQSKHPVSDCCTTSPSGSHRQRWSRLPRRLRRLCELGRETREASNGLGGLGF